MKKPLFVVTEIFLSVVLAAAAAAAAVTAVDLKTDMFGIDKLDPLHIGSLFTHEEETSLSKAARQEVSDIVIAENIQASQNEESLKKKIESQTAVIELQEEPEGLEAQPEELMEYVEAYEYSFEENLYGNKLILVAADNFSNTAKTKLYCYEKSDSGYWWNIAGEGEVFSEEVYIGENGSAYEVTAGSKKTPAGIWDLDKGFYIEEKPDTDYPMFRITDETYWVTDTSSAFFNQRTEGVEEKDWSKAEHMIMSEKSYQYGIVIDYNMENPDIDKPSAIFMHCGNAPTEGCVAVPENIMKTILEWLDENDSPIIWITV